MIDRNDVAPQGDVAVKDTAASTKAEGTVEGSRQDQAPLSLFDRLFRRSSAKSDQDSDGEGSGNASDGQPKTKAVESTTEKAKDTQKTMDEKPKPVDEGAEFDRRVQAEVDRREAQRKDKDTRVQKRNEKKILADADPFKLGEIVKKEIDDEESAEEAGSASAVEQKRIDELKLVTTRTVDSAYTGLMFEEGSEFLLTQDEWDTIQAKNKDNAKFGVGIEGRRMFMTDALNTLKARWEADASKKTEERLRKNKAFRTQVLSEYRTTTDGGVEEVVAAGSAANGHGNDLMNAFIRGGPR